MPAVVAGHLPHLLFDGKESRIAIGRNVASWNPGVLVTQMNWVRKP